MPFKVKKMQKITSGMVFSFSLKDSKKSFLIITQHEEVGS